jgi:hypothetical protein
MTPKTRDLQLAFKARLPHYLGDERCYKLYELFQQLLGYPAVYRAYRQATGCELSLRNPVNIADKITYLKLFDKNPVFPIITDKVRVRPWVAERIGEQYLIPSLGIYNSPDEIDLDSLPDQFIIKVNFDTARNIRVADKHNLDWEAAKTRLANWLKTPQPYHLMEWNHHVNQPRILIEQLLLDERGLSPPDIKFHVYNGRINYIHHRDVGTDQRFDSRHTPQWEPIPMGTAHKRNPNVPPKPENLAEMIQIVNILSAGFTFIRVDLYSVGGRIYFGEMTPHVGSGKFHMRPEGYNKLLGDCLDVSHIRPSWTLLPLR